MWTHLQLTFDIRIDSVSDLCSRLPITSLHGDNHMTLSLYNIFFCLSSFRHFRWLRRVNMLWSHNWFRWIVVDGFLFLGFSLFLFRISHFAIDKMEKMATTPAWKSNEFYEPRSYDHKRLQHSWEIALKRVCKVNGHRKNKTQPRRFSENFITTSCLFTFYFAVSGEIWSRIKWLHAWDLHANIFQGETFIYLWPKAARDREFSASHRKKEKRVLKTVHWRQTTNNRRSHNRLPKKGESVRDFHLMKSRASFVWAFEICISSAATSKHRSVVGITIRFHSWNPRVSLAWKYYSRLQESQT